MFGTELGYDATMPLVLSWGMVLLYAWVWCYDTLGTELGYGATRAQLPPPSSSGTTAMRLREQCAVSRTELAYGAMGRAVLIYCVVLGDERY
eukprot:3940315-Rhodomonas_salina.2